MTGVSSAGVGSGLDLENLITDLINAEAEVPSAELDRKEATINAELTAYGTLKSAAADLKAAVFNLSLQSNYQLRSTSVGDSSIFSATADSTASVGNYNIEVTALAEAHKVGSPSFADKTTTVGTGTLTITVGSTSFDVVIDGSNSTVEGIKAAIEQADDNDLLSATLVTVDAGTQIVLTSNTTGLANTISITANDDDGNDADLAGLSQLVDAHLGTLNTAADATIEIDTQVVTSSTNVFDDAIEGVTITAKKVSTVNETTSLGITLDTGKVGKYINALVDAYNEFVAVTNTLTEYDSETQVAGTLLGDSLTRGLVSQVRNILGDTVSGLTGSIQRTSDLGFTTELDGTITIDSTILNAALTNSNLDDIQTLFADSDNGLANRLDDILGAFANSSGIIDDARDGLNIQLGKVDDARESLFLRLTKLEERLRSQFVNLDVLVSSLRSTGEFLSQQVDSFPGFAKSD